MDILRLHYQQRLALCPQFKEVAGAAGLEDVLKGSLLPDSVYLFRQAVSTGGNLWLGGVSQVRSPVIGIVVVVRNVRDPRGGDSSDECELLCDVIEQQLLGWSPNENWSGAKYGGGNLVGMKNGLYIWRELYSAQRYSTQTI